jgi:2-polyprenyl-3-methyl-5-hydroxy-6-metoxy-1,4-benzoquinol methylase
MSLTATQKSVIGASPEEVHRRLGQLAPVLCPICRKDSPQLFAIDYYGFRIVRCDGCSLLYLNPRPTYAWLVENTYAEEYRESQLPVSRPLDDNHHHQFTRQLNGIERHCRRGRLLDVGCGGGEFLAYAADRGWNIFGTEISAGLVTALGKSLPQGTFSCGRLGDVDFQGRRFDAIRFNHVLEHLQDPVGELTRAAELLDQEGVIYVSVPNCASLDTRVKNFLSRLALKRRRYRHFSTLHHLFFFTPATLALLASAARLRATTIETPVYFSRPRAPWVVRPSRTLLEPFGLGNCVDACLLKDIRVA